MNAGPPDSPAAPGAHFGRAEFDQIAAIAYREAGLAIAPGKSAMVHTRLARRLRALGLKSYLDYCALIASREGAQERREMISALTTNVSHFFREEHHFTRFRQEILPGLREKLSGGGRVRIWSAGCSNGQEPYSIAMSALTDTPIAPDADFKILATDIDPNVIAFARCGVYPEPMTAGLPPDLRARFFHPDGASPAPAWRVSGAVRRLVTFRELNLLDGWPMQGGFDVIFCRNVVIYFDEVTRADLWQRFADVLAPGGWLFLGHSERLAGGCGTLFAGRGMTAYQRTAWQSPDDPAA
jgi:chemotaxis protein methyltransferase CheR